MGKYLVTGGAGFIGSWVARELLEKGNEVTVIDNLTTGYRDNVPAGSVFIKADCQDPAVYERLKAERFNAVLHIAGQSSGEISFDDPVYDLRTNAESTLLLMRYALDTGAARFIYASTMSVYGAAEDKPVNEEYRRLPESFYGVGKIASEEYMRIYQKYGIQPTTLRLFNVYGPGQNLENLRQGMVSIFLAQMIRDEKIVVKGSLERFRDFVYISDVVEAFMTCLSDSNTVGQTFNVATGKKTTVGRLIDMMQELHGKKVPVEVSGSTQGDINGITADISRFRRVSGYEPKVTLKDGLAKMYGWASALKGKP